MIAPDIRRPARVTILVIAFLAGAAWNGLRLGNAIFFWKTLESRDVQPLYLAISGGVWLIIGILLAWGLWAGKSWARMAALGGVIGYYAWYWFDRLVLQQPHANGPFALVITIIILILTVLILFSPKTKRFFQKNIHE
jgi:hypothetical protein